MYHPYTDTDDYIIRTMMQEGKSKAEISAALNRSVNSVKEYVSRMAIRKGFKSQFSANPAIDIILPALKEGKSITEAAFLCKWREVTVRRWARQFCEEGKIPYKTEYSHQTGSGYTCKKLSILKFAAGPIERKIAQAFVNYKERSARRFLPFDLDILWLNEQFKKQEGRCHYTGAVLTAEQGRRMATIDRLDSSKGYTQDNCVIACYAVNTAKNDLPMDKFIKLCHAVAMKHPLT